MDESFLYFVWQHKYFAANPDHLKCTSGERLTLVKSGSRNNHAGPDFSDAHILLDGLNFYGNVEMHLRSSDWYSHGHHTDPAYNSVILHVVWEDDREVKRTDGTAIPTLAVSGLVPQGLLTKYQALRQNASPIACGSQLNQVNRLIRIGMMDRALVQRLERKATEVLNHWNKAEQNWEEAAFWLLAAGFGFKVNKLPMLQLAQSLRFKVLQLCADQLLYLEALLFGQAGFIPQKPDGGYDEGSKVGYKKELSDTYQFLRKKYRLPASNQDRFQWKFLRMRPGNFPTVRLAELAAFLHQQPRFFSKLIYTEDSQTLLDIFKVPLSGYWQNHYDFDKALKRPTKGMGKSSQENLLLNVVAPLLVAYGIHKGNDVYKQRAVSLLEALPAEANHITREWAAVQMPAKSAFDSQALLELHATYCQPKKCLACNIGTALLKQSQ